MQDDNTFIFGSLEAAARFGGRLGLRQQANLPESQAPKAESFEDRLEQMANPFPPSRNEHTPDQMLMQWGRCGYVPSSQVG